MRPFESRHILRLGSRIAASQKRTPVAGNLNFKTTCKLACVCAVSEGVPRRSLYVALVVGTVLNVINQGDAFLGMTSINWLKLVLTYLVPYAVCTYGAVSHQLSRPPGP
jgi:hypothetical protein